jgi:hypothetical protein
MLRILQLPDSIPRRYETIYGLSSRTTKSRFFHLFQRLGRRGTCFGISPKSVERTLNS